MILSPIEITLLNSLEEGKEYTLDSASKISGMNKDAILKAIHLLQEKGIGSVETVERKKFFLTDEGKEYLKKGLPEEKLYKILLKGEIDIDSARKKLGKEFGIAIGWLRKRGLVEIKGDKLMLKNKHEFREREILERVDRGDIVKEEELNDFIKRKLVVFEVDKDIFIKITSKKPVELKEVIKDLTPELLKTGEWKGKEFLRYDIKIPSKKIFTSKFHPYERIIRECREIFLEMGFTEIKGNFVQSSFWNFDALFQPQDHPARDMQDTFYLDRKVEIENEYMDRVRETHLNGWITGSSGWGGEWSAETSKKLVMRTHTTAITIHYLAMNPEPPVKAFCIDRVYRRESIDATHLPEFDQLEGVVLDKEVGFSHLLGLLKEFFLKMGFEDVRFRPGYFPYTEPSVEPEVYVEGLGWIELGGAGVFRKEVTEPLGIKGKVLAWGLGMGRLAMLRLGMKDLRKLYQPDIGWLRELPYSIR